MKSLFYSYDMNVDKAYIIRIKNNAKSEAFAQRCMESCVKAQMPWDYWDAFDGTQGEILIPDHAKANSIIKMLKVTDHYMTRSEVACALSHISLWIKCAEQDKPLVILEHDAIMDRAYTQHGVFNSICYLGSNEQVNLGWQILPTPPHASEGPNYHFICRAHAYAVDPAVAKNMVAHVLKYGINAPLDILLRADIFPIHQMGIYAHDLGNIDTTILGRPKEGRSTIRNDKLEI